MTSRWNLPQRDYWSTPFAESLFRHLDLFPGATVLDVASGHAHERGVLRKTLGTNRRRKRQASDQDEQAVMPDRTHLEASVLISKLCRARRRSAIDSCGRIEKE